jgi:hypothetical protein
VECTNADVDLGRVLGIQSFSMDRMLEMDPDFLVRTFYFYVRQMECNMEWINMLCALDASSLVRLLSWAYSA